MQNNGETKRENNNRTSSRTCDTRDVLLVENKSSAIHQESGNHKSSQQNEELTHYRKERWSIILLMSLTLGSIIISTVLLALIVSVLHPKTNETQVQSVKQMCGVSEAQCCNKTEHNTGHLLNVLTIAHLASDKKDNTAEPSTRIENRNESLIHQEAFLDTRYVQHLQREECLPWLVKNNTNKSEVRYNNRNKTFVIEKIGLYHIYLSIAFRFKSTTEISNTVYKNNDEELLSMNKTIKTTGDESVWSYYDTEMSGLFHLYEGDKLYMQTSNAGSILQYVVCNYFSIFRVPA